LRVSIYGIRRRVTRKLGLGSFYTFDVGNGLTLLGMYHYSGFGVKDMADAITHFEDPVFQQRYLRGDTQFLGRHAVALQLSYPVENTLTGSLLVLQSPADGSGIASPSIIWGFAENISLVASTFIP